MHMNVIPISLGMFPQVQVYFSSIFQNQKCTPCQTLLTRVVSRSGLAMYTKKLALRQKKNHGNSNISPCKNIIFKNNPLRETKILQHIITLELISTFNTSQNIIFQTSSYQNRATTTWGPKSLKLLYSIMNLKHNILALVGKANKRSTAMRD